MAKRKKKGVFPMVIFISQRMLLTHLVKNIIVRSAAVGANLICFITENDHYSIFCSNGERVITIQIQALNERGPLLFFPMIDCLKIMLGMKISEKKISQSVVFEKRGDLPKFKCTTIPTEFGESMRINFL